MAIEKIPSRRALAFKAWMKRAKTNTKRVSDRSGVSYSTLASFVQGDTQSLKGENEQKIAEAFDASVETIFSSGAASPLVRIIGRVGASADGEVIMTTGQAGYDYVPVAPGGTTDSVALEVHGHSMRGFVEDGGLVYFEDQRSPPTPDLIGQVVVVETEDGRVLVKRLLRGSEPNVYDLESANGPTISDARIVWAAEITAIIPPRQAMRIIRRDGEAA